MRIVRYMSLSQLIFLLAKGLFVPKSSLLNDSLEGVYPENIVHIKGRDNVLSEQGWQIIEVSEEEWITYTDYVQWVRDWTYVSSWHRSDEESYAMWKLYGKYDEAIAVFTRLERLISAFEETTDLHGRVYARINHVEYFRGTEYPNYLYESSEAGKIGQLNDPFYMHVFENMFKKHRGFEFEKEVRLVMSHDATVEPGDRNHLDGRLMKFRREWIDEIRLSPNAPLWFTHVIEEVMTAYKIKAETSVSQMRL